MIEVPTGTLLLCDYVHVDRGKFNILGAGWTRCSADRNPVWTLACLQLPPDFEGGRLTVEVAIWRQEKFVEGGSKPEGKSQGQGTMEITGEGTLPPVYNVQMPIPVEAHLVPGTAYVVELTVQENRVAWATFETSSEE